MSLMSLISTGLSQSLGQSSGSSATSASDGVTLALQKLIASKGGGTTATSSNGVNISASAKIAAAEAADNAKDFATLTSDVRATLDAQYKDGGKTPDLSEMSGRALAAIALNRGKDFSTKEVAAAKAELGARTRNEFTASIGGSATMSGLAAYNQMLVSQYDSMSTEEREALGWTDKVRASAASFVGSNGQASLFDQLGNIDDYSTSF